MTRVFQIAFFGCAMALLTGCNGSEKDKPIWEEVKIGDLAPTAGTQRPDAQLLRTINFNAFVFELPADNIGALNSIWPILHTKPLQFNDYDAFKDNSFLVGFGQIPMWNHIRNLLLGAGAEQMETVSLLLTDSQYRDYLVFRLEREQTIYYSSSSGSMEGVPVELGKIGLRIKAEKDPTSRGVCNVSFLPVFAPLLSSPIPQLAARAKMKEFFFEPVGFGLKMSPGEFIFLGPEKYSGHQITLSSLFFSRPKRNPVVRVYLFVCSRID
ncbi:MAG: hypothetical protein JSV82_00440 [Planctomycetota bacterium]|nr:MAG: hypothetical protein JSV82_00440 [Planctomycetota bacterium]